MEPDEQQPANITVIGGASAASGLLAAALVAIGQARNRDRPVDVAKSRIRAVKDTVAKKTPSAGFDRDHAVELASGFVSSGREQATAARERGKQQADRVAERIRGIDTRAASTAASAVTRQVGRARGGVRSAAEAGTEKGLGVADTARDRVQQAGAQATGTAQALAVQAAAAAIAGSDRAREASSALVDAARGKAPQVAQKVSDDVVPTLRDIATQAAGMAIDLWQSTREKAADATEAVHGLPRVDGSHAVEIGTDRLKQATSAVTERAGAVSGKAKDASRRAADATVDTSKDTGALLFWAGAAAGLVFYALLSEERREQVTRTAATVAGQVQELIKDFQGYDDEF